jgi:nicotinamide-nucleotide amidase
LRIVARAPTAAAALEKIAAARKIIYERIGEYAFGEEDEELEHVVVRLLGERKETLAVRESATGGLLAHRLTNVPGHERCLRKAEVLSRLDRMGEEISDESQRPVSNADGGGAPPTGELAKSAALDCARATMADWSLVVSERSRSDDSEERAEAPFVCLAVAGRDGATAVKLNIAGDPAIVKSRVAKSALNLLRLKLLK